MEEKSRTEVEIQGFEEEMRAARSATDRRIQLNKAAILEAMKKVQVKSATVEYTGKGDSGNGVEVSVEGGAPIETDIAVSMVVLSAKWDESARRWEDEESTKTKSLEEALEQMADDLIDLYHRGYENNDGGGGSITFDAEAATVRYDYYDYIVQEESHSVDV